MLKSLSLENFTVFSSAQFEFSPGINVIIGENGTGKTHLLKAAYCLRKAWPDFMPDPLPPTEKHAEVYFEKRFMGLFQPEHLASLIRRGKAEADLSAEICGIECAIFSIFPSWRVSIHDTDGLSATFPKIDWWSHKTGKAIFIPSKEIVSFYEGLGGLLDEYKIKLDATYKDMAVNFDFPELINPPNLKVIQELDTILKGRLELEGRKLVFIETDGYRVETPLLAEGVRKLAMLPYFIRHGLIRMKGETLFWDEPETNLNPRLISKLAEALVILARKGVQIILATHSLFLLKEIDLQLQLAAETSKVPSKFFALSLGNDGVQVSAGENLVDIDPITALDMEIDQADRYNEWYYRASRAE